MSTRRSIRKIENLLERLDAAVVVRDPGTTRYAAEAFDGLRKQIIQSGKNRRIHIAQLISLSDSLDRNASVELIRDRVNDFMSELGLVKLSDTGDRTLFEIAEGDGFELECVLPAIVEPDDDGRFILHRKGEAKRIPGTTSPPPPEPLRPISQDLDKFFAIPIIKDMVLLAVLALIIGLSIGWLVFGQSNSSKGPTTTTIGTTEDTTTTSTTATTIAAATSTAGG